MAIDTIKSTAVLDGAISTADLANDIAINTSGAITTTGAFTSKGIDDNADATAITIDSSENLLVGQSSSTAVGAGNTTTGFSIRNDGGLYASRSSGPTITANVNADGDTIKIYKSGTAVGSIGTQGSRLSIGSGDVNLNFNASANSMYPISNPTSGALSDGIIDVGASTARFKDAYLSGGVYLGGTGAVNKLDDYEEGTWTPILRGSTGTPSGQSYSQQTGTYTKVGRKVHLQAYISVASIGTGMNGTYAYIGGFPFAVSSGNSMYSTGSFSYLHQLGQNVNSLHAYGNQGTDFAYVVYQNGAGTTSAYLSPAGWGSTPSVMFGMTYYTPA